MVIVVIICCAAICAPIAAVNYGIKLYDRHEIDMVYTRKLKKLNKTIHYMDTVEIEVPRVMVPYATGGRTIMDVLVTSAMRMQAACHFFVIDTSLCAGAEEVTCGSQALSDITKSALSEITGCLGRANPEKRYGCKRKLEGLDSSIAGIREASMHLRDALVSFSSGYGPVVMARLGGGAMDIPEYRLDMKSVCDTIPYGPGRWERCSKAIDGLWK